MSQTSDAVAAAAVKAVEQATSKAYDVKAANAMAKAADPTVVKTAIADLKGLVGTEWDQHYRAHYANMLMDPTGIEATLSQATDYLAAATAAVAAQREARVKLWIKYMETHPKATATDWIRLIFKTVTPAREKLISRDKQSLPLIKAGATISQAATTVRSVNNGAKVAAIADRMEKTGESLTKATKAVLPPKTSDKPASKATKAAQATPAAVAAEVLTATRDLEEKVKASGKSLTKAQAAEVEAILLRVIANLWPNVAARTTSDAKAKAAARQPKPAAATTTDAEQAAAV